MTNIICIDLTHFNNLKLVEVAKKYNLRVDYLLENKVKGIARIYIDLSESAMLVA